MDLNQLSQFVETTDVFTEELFKTLNEYVNYESNGMRVVVVESLKVLRERIQNGDDIQFYASGTPFTVDEFKETILESFGEQIFEDVFEKEIE